MSGKSYLPVLGDRGCPARHRLILPLRCPRGACLLCRLPTPPSACFPAPYPPSPLPRRGRGRFLVFLCKGLRPRHPGVKPFTALIDPAIQPSLRRGSLRFDVKPTERLSLEQCRQPRRGGTGGDGTIRRKRRRRLRWSSPPGQGEQVPLGFSPVGRRQRPPRLQRRSNPPDTGAPPGAGKRQMPPKFCRNRLTSTAPIWYNTNNPAGCLPPEKEHGMP